MPFYLPSIPSWLQVDLEAYAVVEESIGSRSEKRTIFDLSPTACLFIESHGVARRNKAISPKYGLETRSEVRSTIRPRASSSFLLPAPDKGMPTIGIYGGQFACTLAFMATGVAESVGK